MRAVASPTFRLLGINDDESTCQACGKAHLKAVYWLENLVNGAVSHVGRTCGPKMLRCTTKEFSAFERGEKAAARKQAQAWFSGRASVIAYRSTLEELNARRLMGAERMAIIQPAVAAVSLDRDEAKRLFPLAADVFLYA